MNPQPLHVIQDPETQTLMAVWRIEEVLAEDLLTASERQAADQEFTSASRRREWVTGRVLAKVLLQNFFEVSPQSVAILGHNAKPNLVWACDPKSLTISFAHSANLFAVAVSAACVVGVDVESHARKIPERLVHRILQEDVLFEWRSFAEPEARARFLQLWCLKEAAVKAGLSQNVFDLKKLGTLKSMQFPVESKKVLWRIAPASHPSANFYAFSGDDFYVVVASVEK